MNKYPIGIFDSGVGGLSVLKEVIKLLPYEDIIYLADSNNCPYGSKNHDEIVELSVANTKFLLSKNCKLIIVACNTATAAAIDTLRDNFNIPFIGMEPAVKPAALNTKLGKIGILATEGTFNGRLFQETSKKFGSGIQQIIQIGEGLVELVEQGKADSLEALPIIEKNIKRFIENEVDHIVLGCTHYPFLIDKIKKLLPASINIIDPAPAIAKRTEQILIENNLYSEPKKPSFTFYSTGKTETIKTMLNEMGLQADIEQTMLS